MIRKVLSRSVRDVVCLVLVIVLLHFVLHIQLRSDPSLTIDQQNKRKPFSVDKTSPRRLDNLFVRLDGPFASILISRAFASSHLGNYVAEHAIDDDRSTRWTSSNRDSEWLAVELNGVSIVDQVEIHWRFAFRGAFTIDTSMDTTQWVTRVKVNGRGKRKDIVSLPSESIARYVRMTGIRKGHIQYGYSMYMIAVRGIAQGESTPPTPDPTPDETPLPTLNPTRPPSSLEVLPIARAFASSHRRKYAAYHAIDKNPRTRWASRARDSEWLAVELAGVSVVDQVKIVWQIGFNKRYSVDTSMDSSVWATQIEVTTNAVKDIIALPNGSPATSFVRISGIDRGGFPIGYSIYDVLILGTSMSGTTPPPSIGPVATTPNPTIRSTSRQTQNPSSRSIPRPTPNPTIRVTSRRTPNPTIHSTSRQTPNPTIQSTPRPTPTPPSGPVPIIVRAYSSSHEKSHVSGNAIDKNPYTRWASDRSDNEWIAVELLQVSSVGCVVLQWEKAYGKEYFIETSTDGRNWETKKIRTNGRGGLEKIQLPSGIMASYVRCMGISRGTKYGYSMWEFDVRRGCNDPPSPPTPATERPTDAARLSTNPPSRPATNPPTPSNGGTPLLEKVGDNRSPSLVFPLKHCQGDCDSPSDCEGSLSCFKRNGYLAIPGCQGQGESNKDYCYYAPSQTLPSPKPQQLPIPLPPWSDVTYLPGDLSVRLLGWKLSRGLTIRQIAHTGEQVGLVNGGRSSLSFHGLPDGAECFPHPEGADRGFAYLSNSENDGGKGGVGAVYFNGAGDTVDYQMLLRGTWRNCGAAKTPWGSYMTMEEQKRGRGIWQVDPWNRRPPELTVLGLGSDFYESFAYDIRNVNQPKFFFTVDREAGPVGRFIPSKRSITTDPNKQWDMLHDQHGEHRWLVLKGGGTFEWSPSKSAGEASSKARFTYGEGIEHHDGKLYLVSKRQAEMFILDLDRGKYSVVSTKRSHFRGQPDQIRFQHSSPRNRDPIYPLLFFTEESGSPGVHARTMFEDWFTVIERDGGGDETSGFALSPDNRFMFVALQHQGRVFQVWRSDGRLLNDPVLRINYM